MGKTITAALSFALLVAPGCGRAIESGEDTGESGSGTSAASAGEDDGDSEDTGTPMADIPGDPKFCTDASDCIPVGCGCGCSGCGGFDYEDIVNEAHYDAWYEDAGCDPPTICATACCPTREVVCVDKECGVFEP